MNHEMMKKMLEKKKEHKGEMSPVKKDAKMGVVKAMRDMASKAMDGKLQGLKKVSVASNSSEGLKHGLEKAKELLSAHESAEEPQAEDNEAMDSIDNHSAEAENESEGEEGSHGLEEESPEHEAEESAEEEADEAPEAHTAHVAHEEHSMSPHHGMADDYEEDDMNAKLEHLMKMKAKKSKK